MKIFFRVLPVLFSILVMSACSAPVVKLEDAHLTTPAHFKNQRIPKKGQEFFLSEKYWERFKDPELNTLVERGLKENSDLKLAAYRIERDFALAGVKLADLFPHMSANPSFERLRLSLNTGQPVTELGIPREHSLYTVPLNFSYEIDLWGRIRNQYKAARAQAKMSSFLYLDTQIHLSAEIAQTYFALRHNAKQMAILKEVVGLQNQWVTLSREKVQAGFAPADLPLALEGEKIMLENERINLEASRLKLLTTLAILINANPSEFDLKIKPLGLEAPPVLLPNAVPAVWIRHRPEIRAAVQGVVAANAMTKSALAEFFPKFTFNARLGFQSEKTSNLFTQASSFFGFGPSVSIPIFDIGQLLENYRAKKIEAKASLETYKKTVLSGFKDVEDRLIEWNEAWKLFQNSRLFHQNMESLTAFSQDRFQAGFTDEMTVFQRRILQTRSEMNIAAEKLRVLNSSIELIRSFGGGLSEESLDDIEEIDQPSSKAKSSVSAKERFR